MRAQLLLTVVLAGGCAAPPPPTPRCAPLPSPRATAAAPTEVGDPVILVGDFAFAIRTRAFANLAHHLDCLAGQIHGSCDAIRAFWKETWTKDDDEAIAAWSAIGTKYTVSASFGGPTPASPAPLPHGEFDAWQSLRTAALLSSSLGEYRVNLRTLLPPQDIERRVGAASHFGARFEGWWTTKAADIAARFRDDLERLFRQGELGPIIGRAARFYASPLPRGTTIELDLVVLPTSPRVTGAEQIGGHGIIEITPESKPADRMDVVCHELFHFFYNARTPEQQAALMGRFGASSAAGAGIAYFLLDEAVATALGNGVVAHAVNPLDFEKRSKRDKGFYWNHAIDATAKGLLLRTKGDPTLGPPLDDAATVEALIAAAHDAVGEAPKPIEYLHSFAGAAEEGWWNVAMQDTLASSSSNNVYSSSPFDGSDAKDMIVRHPMLSSVILVPRGRIAALAAYKDVLPSKVRAEVEREAKRPGAFGYVVARSPHAFHFVIVADDARGAKSVADPLFQSEKPVTGVFRPSSR